MFMFILSYSSGPKRYDVINGQWRYSHNGVALHDLLSQEFSELLAATIDLTKLHYSYIPNDNDSWA